MSDWQTLGWSVDEDGIATLTLSRPDALNAFDLTMARELEQVFLAAASDDSVRAIVVTGEGRAFCAGMDLSAEGNVFGLDETVLPTPEELRDHLAEAPYHDGVRDTGGRVTLAIHACNKPVIAAINGAAVGIGATMTLAMDVRLASTKAKIGFVFGRLGIVPEATSTWFLPRIVGLQQALEWIYSADILTADQALDRPPRALGPRARRPAPRGVRPRSRRGWSAAPRWRWRSRASSSTATAPPRARSTRTSPTRWRCTTPRSATGRKAWRRSARSATRSSRGRPRTCPGSSRAERSRPPRVSSVRR